jgi:hypothetical protein
LKDKAYLKFALKVSQADVREPMEGIPSWQVLRVALLFPIFGKVLPVG